jgi:hypothetical protein
MSQCDADEREFLSDVQELLLRQVHPSWLEEEIPSLQAFGPTTKDERMLSVDRGSLRSPEEAFLHHTQELGLKSAGTWAVTVGEVVNAGLSSRGDPIDGDPAHSFVDFRGCSRRDKQTKAAVLLARACARGRLHPAVRDRS